MSSEAFFENTGVRDIVQNTIDKVDSLTASEQRKLLGLFRQVRRDLQDRLLTIPEGTFTENQLNITLIQIQAAIQAIKLDLKDQLQDSSRIFADKGIEDLTREIEFFSKKFEGNIHPINIDRILIAQESTNFLINKHDASIDAYAEALRSQITSNIVQSMAMRESSDRTVSRIVNQVGKFFMGEEWKIQRIARTELSNIYNFSKMRTMTAIKEDNLPDLRKSLMHPFDSRTGEDSKQLAKLNPIVKIDQPFVFVYTRKLASGEVRKERREFQFPPDRPNDRSILVPYRTEWGKQAVKITN